jgi:hypothetical protein
MQGLAVANNGEQAVAVCCQRRAYAEAGSAHAYDLPGIRLQRIGFSFAPYLDWETMNSQILAESSRTSID